MGKRPAFSLIELLLVIGIIGLLLAILLPALGQARAVMRRTACASNLRQIGNFLAFYRADDPRGDVPYAWDIPAPYRKGVRVLPPAPTGDLRDSLAVYDDGADGVYRCHGDPFVFDRTAAASPKGWGTSYVYFFDGWVGYKSPNPLLTPYARDNFHNIGLLRDAGGNLSAQMPRGIPSPYEEPPFFHPKGGMNVLTSDGANVVHWKMEELQPNAF